MQTSNAKSSCALVVYKNAVVVIENRSLQRGTELKSSFKLRVSDIPKHIHAHSIWFESESMRTSSYRMRDVDLSALDGFSSELLKALIGSDVSVSKLSGSSNSKSEILTIEGELKSIDSHLDSATLHTKEDGITIVTNGIQLLKSKKPFGDVSDRIETIPTLELQTHSFDRDSRSIFRIGYTARGIHWKAAYILTLSADEKQMTLYGKLGIKNHTNANFPNAKVSVVDGNLLHDVIETQTRRVEPLYTYRREVEAMEDEEDELVAVPRQLSVPSKTQNYSNNRYEVEEIIDIDSQPETDYAGFFHKEAIPVKKLVVYDTELSMSDLYTVLQWSNAEEEGGPGTLPLGTYDVYQLHEDEDRELLGATHFEALVPDIDSQLLVGKVTNVSVFRKEIKRTASAYDDQLKSEYSQVDIRATITNYRHQDVTVTLFEHFWGKSGYVTTSESSQHWQLRKTLPNSRQEDLRTAFESFVIPSMDIEGRPGVRTVDYTIVSYQDAVIKPSAARCSAVKRDFSV